MQALVWDRWSACLVVSLCGSSHQSSFWHLMLERFSSCMTFGPWDLCLFSPRPVHCWTQLVIRKHDIPPKWGTNWVKWVLPKQVDVVDHWPPVCLSSIHIHLSQNLCTCPTHPVAFSVGVKSSIIIPTPHAWEIQLLCDFPSVRPVSFLSQTCTLLNTTCY